MSLDLIFKGSVSMNLWNSETVLGQGGDPPVPPSQDPNSQVKDFSSIFNQNIVWSGNVPNDISVITINEIFKSPWYFIMSQNYIFTATSGIQQLTYLSEPSDGIAILLYLNGNAGQKVEITANSSTGSYKNSAPGNYQLTSVTPDNIENFTNVTGLPWNVGHPRSEFPNNEIVGLTLGLKIDITLTLPCNSTNIDTGYCLQYCLSEENYTACLDPYIQYCITPTNVAGPTGVNENINLFTSQGCFNFFKDYIQNTDSRFGPKGEIDTPLTAVCAANFKGFDDLTSTGNQQIIDVCACHLSDELYITLRNSLIAAFPEFKAVSENERCLYPPCISSAIKTADTTRVCALPKCINIASITNGGTVKNGTSISQDCKNKLNEGGGGGNNTTVTEWFDKNWIWIVLGGGILLVFIIIIIIFIIAENKKKK